MKRKRVLTALLALCLCVPVWAGMPAAGAAEITAPAFTDVTDPLQAEAAELLRLLGVVSGDGQGHFSPDHALTRAEFCAMAIGVRRETAKAEAMKNYTFYNDVRGDHWARGFINYASRITVGGTQEFLVGGVGNGSFAPDDRIRFSEAVTMTTRLLGYSSVDALTSPWYAGYMEIGRNVGLLDGIEGLDDPDGTTVTRGQAAVIFKNLLFASPKDGGSTGFENLGGTRTGELLVLSTDATAADGTAGCLELTDGSQTFLYKTDRSAFAPELRGSMVRLMLDEKQRVLTVEETDTVNRKEVILAEHQVTYITTAAGERLSVPGTTVLYRGSDKTTYGAVYMDLKPGAPLTLAYGLTGQLEYICVPAAADTSAEAAIRITGIYENASPSPKTPLTVQVMGVTFPVTGDGVDQLAALSLGDRITLSITANGEVVGASPAGKTPAAFVGMVISGDSTSAVISPIPELKDISGSAVTISGKVSSSAEKLVGELVTVTSSQRGYLNLSKVGDSAVTGTLNVAQRTLNGSPLADRVYLYERTAGGPARAITWEQITVSTVPASKIAYAGTDLNGRVNLLILTDVTGDGYSYGFLSPRTETVDVPGSGGLPATSYDVNYIDVTNATGANGFRTRSVYGLKHNVPGGVAVGVGGWASQVTLTEVKSVPRSSFRMDTMTASVSGLTFPISEQVQCYNKITKSWFSVGAEGLNAARAYSETLTVYYDATPARGGKIRLVVVE